MSSRRSFFRAIAKAACIVALAPQIAFRVKPSTFGTVDGVITSHRAWTQEDVNMSFMAGPRFTLYDFILDQHVKPNAYRAYLEGKA